MKSSKYHYSYNIVFIGEEGDTEGYKAVIPKFPGMLIMADKAEELPELVDYMIEIAIEQMKEEGLPIPPPDSHSKFSGKFLVRLKPELHQKLAHLAQASNTSLNKYIESTLEKFLS